MKLNDSDYGLVQSKEIITSANDIIFQKYEEDYNQYVQKCKIADKNAWTISLCLTLGIPILVGWVLIKDFRGIVLGILGSLGAVMLVGLFHNLIYPFLISHLIEPIDPEFILDGDECYYKDYYRMKIKNVKNKNISL